MDEKYTSIENEAQTEFSEKLGEIEGKIVDLVYKAICDITVYFDYFRPSREQVVEPIVKGFLSGKIT
jgi:hypothetical protein